MAWYHYLIILILVTTLIGDIKLLYDVDLDSIPYFPKGIKEEYELTWFGAIFVFIFFLIFLWFHYLIILILLIFKGWKWLKEHLYD